MFNQTILIGLRELGFGVRHVSLRSKRSLLSCAALWMATSAFAGLRIELRTNVDPGDVVPNTTYLAEVYVVETPADSEPQRQFRGMRLSFSGSSGVNLVSDPILDWDFPNDIGAGIEFFLPNVASWIWPLGGANEFMPTLITSPGAPADEVKIADFEWQATRGDFVLDIVSPTVADPKMQAILTYGFGIDPDDPVVLLSNGNGFSYGWRSPTQSGYGSFVVQGHDIWFVDSDASGANTGGNWSDAFHDLESALGSASPGDQVWVAAGVYLPTERLTPADARSSSFRLREGVALYGGFAGGENSLDQRDWVVNETILSGDLSGDDVQQEQSDCCSTHGNAGCSDSACEMAVCSLVPTCCAGEWNVGCAAIAGTECEQCSGAVNIGENSYHVVAALEVGNTTILDGFVVTHGNADITSPPLQFGGGMYNHMGTPIIRNCVFTGNRGAVGAGLCNDHGAPTIVGCTFTGNFAFGNGGGLASIGTPPDGHHTLIADSSFIGNTAIGAAGLYDVELASCLVKRCVFEQNRALAVAGAAAVTHSPGVITNSIFRGNSAGSFDGAMLAGYSHLMNCFFSGNTAPDTGAVEGSGMRLINCAVVSNSADIAGGISVGQDAQIWNTILWANSDASGEGEEAQILVVGSQSNPIVGGCCIQNVDTTHFHGAFGDDPLLFDIDGLDNVSGTSDDDVRLLSGSPCIDAGHDNILLSDGVDLDDDGNLSERTPLDLYENARIQNEPSVPDDNFYTFVDIGVFEFGPVDCNDNDIPDDIDIAAGTSEDCNSNLIPDECDDAHCVEFSWPPDGSVDARSPFDELGNPVGWTTVELTFTSDPSPVSLGAFVVAANPEVSLPGIESFTVNGPVVTFYFEAPLPPGAWITITHQVSGTFTRVGYLPGDVNGDRTASPRDILALIDAINGASELPIWSTDIDGSGTATASDVLKLVDLFSTCNPPYCWLFASLPEVED